MGPGSAGRHNSQVWAPKSQHDREVARHHVDDATGNVEWRNSACALLKQNRGSVFYRLQAPYSSTNQHPDSIEVYLFEVDPGVLKGLQTGTKAQLNEPVHFAHILRWQAVQWLEPGCLPGDLHWKVGGIEPCHRSNPIFARQKSIPGLSGIESHRGNTSQPGHYYPSRIQHVLALKNKAA